MRVAALYDVHGNAPALAAFLADLARVDAVLFGGDLVWGAWPRETLELARSLGDRARFVMGNTDRSALTAEDDPSAVVAPDSPDDLWADVLAGDYDTAGTAVAWRATGFPRTDFADELERPYSHEQLAARLR